MADNLPNAQKLAASLAKLHKEGVNLQGKYGFSVPTLQGTVPQYTDWENSWEICFSKSISIVMANEEDS